MVEALEAVALKLDACQLSGMEAKQMKKARESIDIFKVKLGNGALDAECCAMFETFATALSQTNHAGAGQAHAQLTDKSWHKHKDVLQGLKALAQMAKRKGV